VYKAPSTGSPVIGKAPRGAVVEVTRHLGDWVKVTWAEAPDAAGYMHLSTGSIAPRGSSTPKAGAPVPARQGDGASRALVTSSRAGEAAAPRGTLWDPEPVVHEHPVAASAVYVQPPTHRFGFGGQVSGSTLGFGGSARIWTAQRLGVQFEITRYEMTNPAFPGRVTAVQVAPSAMYSLKDRVTDYFWLRPYVGGGVRFQRQSLSDPSLPGVSTSQSKLGYQAFGGSEITFPGMARFALSADGGYRWGQAPYDGFELGGFAFTLSGHWYWR
jgi:hypothetical protein